MYFPLTPYNIISEGIFKKSGIIFDGYINRLIHQKLNTEFIIIKWVNNVKVIFIIQVLLFKVTILLSFVIINL